METLIFLVVVVCIVCYIAIGFAVNCIISLIAGHWNFPSSATSMIEDEFGVALALWPIGLIMFIFDSLGKLLKGLHDKITSR